MNGNILIKNALVFDGSGAAPGIEDVGITDGKISARASSIDATGYDEVVDASGQWLMPGLLDIHTHLDLEVELNPGLGEAIRHGTTTVLVGNCSLGTAFGKQLSGDDNPIVDCFTRVENVPKKVLDKCVDAITWDNTEDYLRHFEQINLGPNIAAFVPHSMLRIEVMGTNASVSRPPTADEEAKMQRLMREAMEQGYLGLSTDQIVFHYLANDPNKDSRIPAHFAEDEELKPMLDIVRDYGGVWQTNPDSQRMGRTLKRFFWSSGRLHKKPLKISALTAIDFVSAPGMYKSMLRLAGMINSWLFKGKMHFQALGANFRMWSDGIIAPMFEELESTRALIACEVDDEAARRALLDDPKWQEEFRNDWKRVSHGRNTVAFLANKDDRAAFQLDLATMYFDDTPVESWNGDSMAAVYQRLLAFQRSNGEKGAKAADEVEVFAKFPLVDSEAEFYLQGIRMFDMKFRWWLDTANLDEDIVEEILFDANALPGFNDSGAHLTNMAFYDCNLNTLRIAQKRGVERVADAVRRLTSEPAEFFGLDVGSISVGQQADLVLMNPDALKAHDVNAQRMTIYNEKFENDVMVNRSDGVVEQVYVNGVRVWEEGERFTDALGNQTLGRALRANFDAA